MARRRPDPKPDPKPDRLLEELQQTARLWLMTRPAPLTA